ncbi:Blue-light-activated protein [Hartmannibacter diazotrophicus]|uniref:histidine kinase n=1 Tax=Hartmannibacter diazotrophicus TaxID=1482074 RepID=A0A2C9D724_9HYPH|nr:response regulator [Hartmannibacter diazotrophicus]SON56086.1 Blue-light-activated protein [Hartmannibacter diazotrophicus]
MPSIPTYRLLLVEDNPGDAELTAEWLSDLRDFHLEIASVYSLGSAQEMLRNDLFDGVLLDLNLPDSTGTETLAGLMPAAGDVPVIVFSGLTANPDLALELEELGAADVLSKNETNPRLLAHVVRSMLRRASAERLHRQFESLLGRLPDAVLVTDGAGIVQFANPAALDLLGVSYQDLMGNRAGLPEPEGATGEIELPRGADRRICEMRVVECSWNRRPAHLAMIRDVTEQRSLGEQLRQAQKMEALGLLSGGIAHDFNNLLLVIMLYADIIKRSAAGRELRNEISEIGQAIERARSMTRQLLTFARRQPAEAGVVNLVDIVEETAKLLRRTLPANIEVLIHGEPDIWPVVLDRGQVEQVLMNLAINARDVLPDGGRIEFSIANEEANGSEGEDRTGGDVVLRVADNGSGIPPDILPRIFEPFFTTKSREHGTGLGLANCYAIVTQAGGRIAVDSRVGEGTTFTIRFPRIHPETQREPAATEQGGAVCPCEGTILLVDDDAAVARAACAVLESEGYTVICAVTGEDGLEAALTHAGKIDLVLTDVVMPRMSGPDMAKRLREAGVSIPILFMTGYSDHAILQQGGKAQLDGHAVILKPFQPTDLLSAVQRLMGQGERVRLSG